MIPSTHFFKCPNTLCRTRLHFKFQPCLTNPHSPHASLHTQFPFTLTNILLSRYDLLFACIFSGPKEAHPHEEFWTNGRTERSLLPGQPEPRIRHVQIGCCWSWGACWDDRHQIRCLLLGFICNRAQFRQETKPRFLRFRCFSNNVSLTTGAQHTSTRLVLFTPLAWYWIKRRQNDEPLLYVFTLSEPC